MAGDNIIVRVVSEAGRNRVEIDSRSTVEELKEIISEKIGIRPSSIKFYKDMGHTKAFNVSDTISLMKAGIENGTQIFIPNKEAKFKEAIHKPHKADDAEEEKIDTSKPGKHSSTGAITQPGGEKDKKNKDGLTPDCRHGPKGKCLHCIGVDKNNFKDVEYSCNHPKNEMCANCKDKSVIQDAKHIPFDHHLKEMRSKCKKKHKPDQRCQDCIPLQDISYKMRTDCTSHKPYPLGMCNKCIPQSCILNRQFYRHVDYISILNYPELQKFVDNWQSLH